MNRSSLPFRILGAVGVVMLLVLALVYPAGALSPLLRPAALQPTPGDTPTPMTPEPTEPGPRPTATAAPYLVLNPVQGVAYNANPVTATGGSWTPGHTIRLYWDDTSGYLGETAIRGDGTFEYSFVTPAGADRGRPGMHQVLAFSTAGGQASALYELIAPTPSNTPTDTNTPTATLSPTPTTPTSTPSPTLTPTASPTLRPVTPMVTITPFPPTRPPAVVTRPPAATRAPATSTPRPGTATHTLTPSNTPPPTDTPGPGTPSVTPRDTSTPTPTPSDEISDTGGGWGTIFLWGFVLACLLLVFRLLRVRSLQGQD